MPQFDHRAGTDLLSQVRAFADVDVRENVALWTQSRWRIGGPADALLEPKSTDSLSAILKLLSDRNIEPLIIGDGSNLLFDDDGFRGVIIKIGRALSDLSITGNHVVVQSGIWTPAFAHEVGRAGLKGLEHIVGIPGTLGGLIVMNGGSKRKGIEQYLKKVVVFDKAGESQVLDHAACGFAYRRSIFQNNGLIVVEAEFELPSGNRSLVRREMIDIMASRRKKFPLKLPNCGSVFVSDPALYASLGPPGAAIEAAGLRGHRIGDAQIAPEHGNFIVNLGSATSADVLELIRLIRGKVYERTGIEMDCEVRHVSPFGHVLPAHEASTEKLYQRHAR